MDWNFDYQMSLSKSNFLYSNNCLRFLKGVVPLEQGGQLKGAFPFCKGSLDACIHNTAKMATP